MAREGAIETNFEGAHVLVHGQQATGAQQEGHGLQAAMRIGGLQHEDGEFDGGAV